MYDGLLEATSTQEAEKISILYFRGVQSFYWCKPWGPAESHLNIKVSPLMLLEPKKCWSPRCASSTSLSTGAAGAQHSLVRQSSTHCPWRGHCPGAPNRQHNLLLQAKPHTRDHPKLPDNQAPCARTTWEI